MYKMCWIPKEYYFAEVKKECEKYYLRPVSVTKLYIPETLEWLIISNNKKHVIQQFWFFGR